MNENLKDLRRILDQTQAEFAATIGVSKDTVASWETGRNRLSAGMALRIALATGVEERSLQDGGGPLRTRHPFRRQPFTREEFERHQKLFWGASPEASARRQVARCADALELLFTAAARSGEGSGAARLSGVLDAFSQWCEAAREDFQLGEQIELQLAQRKSVLPLNKTYAQWREMAKADPELTRKIGFKDDPKRSGKERLRLNLETVPLWRPGQEMRRKSKEPEQGI
jgi:transcriptional regulator with XRE-family HTH domain